MRKSNLSENILTEIGKEDNAYLEWYQICEAFCKKIGAELLFVNSDSFGYKDKNGNLIHIYADELEQYLKNNKLSESTKDRNGDFIIYRSTPVGPEYISGMSTSFKKEEAIKFPTEEEAKEYLHEYSETVVDTKWGRFKIGRLNELNESVSEKEYYILKTHRDRKSLIKGTLERLTQYFGYTLLCGHSYNSKINQNPKSIKSLIDNVNAGYRECQRGYDVDHIELATDADIEKYKDTLNESAEDLDKKYLGFKKDVLNVLEMYYENLEDEDDDVFAGTEDAYAIEVASQNLFDVIYYAIKDNYTSNDAAMTTANNLTNYLLDATSHTELTWENDGAIREVYDDYVVDKSDLKEGVETAAGNDFDEVASYMYDEALGNVDYIPSFERTNDYIASVSKKEYNALYKAVKSAIENVADNMYNGYIELSDRATINRLTGETLDDADSDSALQVYQDLCDKAFKNFEDETKVEIWQDGRMGRHIVVADNYENARDYDNLCKIQEKWENWVVDEFAKAYSKDNI